MGVASSKSTRTTRKSSSPKNRTTYKFERFSTPSSQRVSSPMPAAPPPSPRLSPAAMGSLYFDRGLPIWAKIEKYLTTHDKDRAVFFFAETAESRYTKSTIVSRPVIRWFDKHWDHIMSFCGDADIADDKARLRFRGDVYANIAQNRGSNASSSTPRTSSSRFSDYVNYDRNVALCIRADGLIEGFMLITNGYRGDMELDVICSGKRGKGVGLLMVQTFKRYTVDAGRKSITLTAVRSSIGFYKKLGFKPVNPEEDDGYDDMDMIWTPKPPSYSAQPPGSGAGGRSGTQ